MKDKRKGSLSLIVRGVLRVLSWIYTVAIGIVDWEYKSGIRKQHDVSVPVVSIGNITLGGTGKTPFAVYLADHFVECNKKPAILP